MATITIAPGNVSSGASVSLPSSSAHSAIRLVYGLRPGQIAPTWELLRPLPIIIGADEDGWYVLNDTVFQVYGDGDTLIEAQRDYITSLIDYYRMVERDVLDGDDPARRELERIQTYMRPHTR